MPRNAIAAGAEHVLGLRDMAALLQQFSHRTADGAAAKVRQPKSAPSPFSCPDCNGVLWEVDRGPFKSYRCRVGHAYSTETLQERKDEGMENALWSAIRALEEQCDLSRRAARWATESGNLQLARRLNERAARARWRAKTVREALPSAEAAAIEGVTPAEEAT
jgi:two-component system, chemotaxis family, protein-glutamate methylesterase/glutaminase